MIRMLAWQFLILLGAGFVTALMKPKLTGINLNNVLAKSPRLQLTIIILGVLLLWAFSLAWIDSWAMSFPLRIQRDAMVLVWILTMLLIGIMAGYGLVIAFRTQDKERWVLGIAIILLEFGIAKIFYPSVITLTLSQPSETTPDGVTLQSTSSSCAAASLANIARHFQIELTESKAANLMGTTLSGSTPGQIRYAIHQIGLQFRMIQFLPPPQIDLVVPPALLWVDDPVAGKEKHAVAYFGKQDSNYEVWDPLKGKLLLSPPEVSRLWHGKGIEVSRHPF